MQQVICGLVSALELSDLVHFPPMSDARYINLPCAVVDGVDHAIVADANPPFVLTALSFLQPCGLGSTARLSILGKMRATTWLGSREISFSALEVSEILYSGT